MKIDSLQLQGYTVFERQNLQNFGDLNIIIGPNNSGKTSLLRAITKISKIERGRAPLQDSERFYEQQDRRVRLDFSLADENIVLESDNMGSLELPGEGSFDEPDVLFCETERLTDYKNTNLDEFLSDQLQSVDSEKFLNALNEIVDPNIADLYGSLTGGGDLQLSTSDQDGNSIQHELNRHGSGVKSIAMLLADIYAADPDILLIDEPEMGLYPAAKRRFLKLLLELSEEHQVFITTQDASFVNPLFWRDSEQDISVYHYSVSRNMQGREPFLDLEINEPSTFAGFLPQATSIKDYHLYVEGKDDVKVIRSYLHSFLDRAASGETQGDLLDRTEIYHLNGSNWEHFLSTIPSSPYSSVVLLDNDMDGQADNVIERYERSGYQSFPDFVKCEETEDIREHLQDATVPVYLLENEDISEYIGVKDKQDIAEEAWNQRQIPQEIVDIFYNLYENELPGRSEIQSRIEEVNRKQNHRTSNDPHPVVDSEIESFADKIGTSPRRLLEVVDIDPDREHPPFLLVDPSKLGDTKGRRQLMGSLLILAVFVECYEGERVSSSLLKDTLEFSDIDSANMSNMYNLEDASRLFDKKGKGQNATIALTRPGRREAYGAFRKILEEVNE